MRVHATPLLQQRGGPLGLALPSGRGVLSPLLLLQDGHNQVVFGHQVVLHHKACEAVT